MTSKRLPGKNLALLGANPLIWYSIQVAKSVPLIDTIIVSSESDEVLSYAKKLGVQSHARKNHQSAYHFRNIDLLREMIYDEKATEVTPEIVVLLQPTHPLRRTTDLCYALETLMAQPKADSLISVVDSTNNFGRQNKNGFYQPFLDKSEDLYRNTGSFYILRPETTIIHSKLITANTLSYVLTETRLEVDIDYPEDLARAKSLVENGVWSRTMING